MGQGFISPGRLLSEILKDHLQGLFTCPMDVDDVIEVVGKVIEVYRV